MFPGAGAQVYYNEAGEPLGWDYPSYDEPYDPDAEYGDAYHDRRDAYLEGLAEDHEDGKHHVPSAYPDCWECKMIIAAEADRDHHYLKSNSLEVNVGDGAELVSSDGDVFIGQR